IDDAVMCEKLRQFVYASREIHDMLRADAGGCTSKCNIMQSEHNGHQLAAENLSIFAVIMRSGEEPVLSRPQIQRVARAQRAHKRYLLYRETLADSDDDDGPQEEDAWLFEDLKVLTELFSRLRDREQLIALIFEVCFSWLAS